jgi:D-arabinose 1-dehydrogenase-like Zn-dependent alcohol dehydrogenase
VADSGRYLPLMANRSYIYPITISGDDFKIPNLGMIQKEITVRALCASTMVQVGEMLEFAGRHKVRPIIEEFPMSLEGINEALERLEKGRMRYRGVLKVGE